MKIVRAFHLLISLSAIIIILIPQHLFYFDNGGFCPYNRIMSGPQEQLLADLIIIAAAFYMSFASRKLSVFSHSLSHPAASALLMGSICFGFYLRYFSSCSALFAILSLLDALLICCLWIRCSGANACSILGTFLSSVLFIFSIFICSIYYLFRWGVS